MELTIANENPRLADLLVKHQEVLKRLSQKRRELQRFKDEAEGVRSQLAGFMAPLEDRSRSLDDELHALFATILNSPKRSKRAKREVEDLYVDLQRWGTISPRTIGQERGSLDDDIDDFQTSGPGPGRGRAAPEPEHEIPGQEPHRGRSGDKKGLRTIFLKLAAALHPDKVQDDLEKERRTQLMKELNRAYRDGDIARILEIESSLSIETFESGGGDQEGESERRCRILAAQNQLLAAQYQEVLNDLLERRRSMLGEAVIEVRRNRRAGAVDPFRSIVEPIAESVESVAQMRDHVEAFAKGRMSLDAFLEGPMGLDDSDDDDEELCDCPACTAMREKEFLELMDILGEFVDLEHPNSSRPRAKAARKRQKAARKKNRKK